MIVQISDIFVVVTAAAIFFFHPPFNIRIFLSAFYYPHFFIRIRHPQVSGPRFTDTHCNTKTTRSFRAAYARRARRDYILENLTFCINIRVPIINLTNSYASKR